MPKFEDVAPEDGNEASGNGFGEIVKIPVGKKIVGLVYLQSHHAKSEYGEFIAHEFVDVTDDNRVITLIGSEATAWGRALNKALLVDNETLEPRLGITNRLLTIGKSETVSRVGRKYHTLVFSVGKEVSIDPETIKRPEAPEDDGDDGAEELEELKDRLREILKGYKKNGLTIKEARERALQEIPEADDELVKDVALETYF